MKYYSCEVEGHKHRLYLKMDDVSPLPEIDFGMEPQHRGPANPCTAYQSWVSLSGQSCPFILSRWNDQISFQP